MNQPTTSLNSTVGTFVMRVLLEVIFFIQGYGKVFTWGKEVVYNNFEPYEQKSPGFLVKFAAYCTTLSNSSWALTCPGAIQKLYPIRTGPGPVNRFIQSRHQPAHLGFKPCIPHSSVAHSPPADTPGMGSLAFRSFGG